MTAEQRGWYIQLLCEAWDSEIQGTLPNDPKMLWILAGAENEQVFNTCSTPVISMFKVKGDSLYHERLMDEYSKQQMLSEARSRAGVQSGKSRRQIIKDKHVARLNTCSTDVEHEANRGNSLASASAFASAKKPATEVLFNEIQVPKKDGIVCLIKIPENLQTPEFTKIWEEWQIYRKRIKKSKDWNLLWKRQLEELSKWGVDSAVESLGEAMRHEWQGFFKPDMKKVNGHEFKKPVLVKRPSFDELKERGVL